MAIFLKTILLSVRRRKRQVRYVSLAAFVSVLFLSAVSVFQNVMNQYLMEQNVQNYGNWILSAVNEELEHPYFSLSASCSTGAEFQDEKGEPGGLHVGTAGEDFRKLGNIALYEGRLPQADNEIAMNLPALAALGYRYELGQKIRLPLDREKEFVLVGTVENFAENWKSANEYPLPDCLVTKRALQGLGGAIFTTRFYQLDKKYREIDTEEFAAPFLSSQESGTRVYNSYVYDNRVWGSPVMFRTVELILICIAMLSMGYLLVSYTAKRRKWYYRMRCAGADRGQIWRAICVEGLYGTLPSAAAALLLPYPVGSLLCLVISRAQKISWFFTVEPAQLLFQGASVLAAILAAVLVACVSCSDRRLSGNVQEITEAQRRRLRRDVKKKKDPARRFVKRQNRIHPYQNAASAVLSVVVCGVLLLCVNLFYEKWSAYREAVRTQDDFSAKYTVEKRWDQDGNLVEDAQEYQFSTTLYDMYDGMGAAWEARLDALIGVKRAEKRTLDQTHDIDWDKKDQSQIMQRIKEAETGDPLAAKQSTLFYYYDSYEQAAGELGKLLKDTPLDKEAFEAGEEVLLLTDYLEQEMDEAGNIKDVLVQEDTIKSGDTATIQSAEYPGKVSVRTVVKSVGGSRGMTLLEAPRIQFLPYTVIASRALAQRIARADGKTIKYNRVYSSLNEHTSFEATPKQLSALFTAYGMEYASGWEEKNILRENVIRQSGIYGALFCVILSIYLLLLLNLNQTQRDERAKRYRLLKYLGMSDSFFLRMTTRAGVAEALRILPGVLCGYGLLIGRSWVRWSKIWDEDVRQGVVAATYSHFLGEYTDERFWSLLENVLQDMKSGTNAVLSGGLALLLMGAVAAVVVWSDVDIIRKEKGAYEK